MNGAENLLHTLVGDHADDHLQYDAPLTSDVPGHASLVSDYVRVSESADDLAQAGADAVQASMLGAGRVATFIAPANHAWEEATKPVSPRAPAGLEPVEDDAVDAVAEALGNGRETLLFLGGRLLCEVFPTRLQRGAGRAGRPPWRRRRTCAQLKHEGILHSIHDRCPDRCPLRTRWPLLPPTTATGRNRLNAIPSLTSTTHDS